MEKYVTHRKIGVADMRLFCLRHLFLIFAVCLIATSSYVLFDLLDIDGSNFKEHAQVCGFEAVMPACGGEIRSPATNSPAPWPAPSHALLFTAACLASFAPRPFLSSISRYLASHTRKDTKRESASLERGNDPARRVF